MTQTWDEMILKREQMKQILSAHNLGAPSRKRVSYNWSERHMRKAFNGSRIPEFAQGNIEREDREGFVSAVLQESPASPSLQNTFAVDKTIFKSDREKKGAYDASVV